MKDSSVINISPFHQKRGSLKDPEMWIAAASQNAFDTGAGIGALATFAAFMSRQRGAVRYGTIIPMLNNLVR
ncbi:unnamed protein product [Schistosoma mattheei]|uniref:Uncharacterized protein n=1 Tax=Schistosoma mattheei TaxID=31246 RepID=A0A183PWS4_9TREM|nr:unnamed protein product [Schistosoma mattheei]